MDLERSILVHAHGGGSVCPSSVYRNVSCNTHECPEPTTLFSDGKDNDGLTKTGVIVVAVVSATVGVAVIAAIVVWFGLIPYLATKKAAVAVAADSAKLIPLTPR